MKKLFLVLSVAGMLALTSCSKDYTCSCDGDVVGEITGKKGDAETACEAFEIGGFYNSCTLD